MIGDETGIKQITGLSGVHNYLSLQTAQGELSLEMNKNLSYLFLHLVCNFTLLGLRKKKENKMKRQINIQLQKVSHIFEIRSCSLKFDFCQVFLV